MSIYDPLAFDVFGNPKPIAPLPQLRIVGENLNDAQMTEAQRVFARFCETARLSRNPMPTERGRLGDGSEYRIMTVGTSRIMQVWLGTAGGGGEGGGNSCPLPPEININIYGPGVRNRNISIERSEPSIVDGGTYYESGTLSGGNFYAFMVDGVGPDHSYKKSYSASGTVTMTSELVGSSAITWTENFTSTATKCTHTTSDGFILENMIVNGTYSYTNRVSERDGKTYVASGTATGYAFATGDPAVGHYILTCGDDAPGTSSETETEFTEFKDLSAAHNAAMSRLIAYAASLREPYIQRKSALEEQRLVLLRIPCSPEYMSALRSFERALLDLERDVAAFNALPPI